MQKFVFQILKNVLRELIVFGFYSEKTGRKPVKINLNFSISHSQIKNL